MQRYVEGREGGGYTTGFAINCVPFSTRMDLHKNVENPNGLAFEC